MRWVLLIFLGWVIGCARPDFVAFPQSDPATAPPANTDDAEATAPVVMRARFPARASMAQINKTACGLQPMLVIGGVQRKVDMRIGGVTPCGTPNEGALRVNVFVSSDGGREVVLELTVPTGSTTQDTNDLKLGLREVRGELERRIGSLPPDVLVTGDAPVRVKPKSDHRRSSRVLTVAEVLLISGGAAGAAAAIMTAAGATAGCCSNTGWIIAGGTTFLFGSAPVILGGIVTVIIAGAMYANED